MDVYVQAARCHGTIAQQCNQSSTDGTALPKRESMKQQMYIQNKKEMKQQMFAYKVQRKKWKRIEK